jgi:anti-sigma factor ChrR (cupin superfamily)
VRRAGRTPVVEGANPDPDNPAGLAVEHEAELVASRWIGSGRQQGRIRCPEDSSNHIPRPGLLTTAKVGAVSRFYAPA